MINVQGSCDSNTVLTQLVARWPGQTRLIRPDRAVQGTDRQVLQDTWQQADLHAKAFILCIDHLCQNVGV